MLGSSLSATKIYRLRKEKEEAHLIRRKSGLIPGTEVQKEHEMPCKNWSRDKQCCTLMKPSGSKWKNKIYFLEVPLGREEIVFPGNFFKS